jgi:nucleotide-binding universal stress UspA family protein
MTIVCGIDFSENAVLAAHAAGAIAMRLAVPLTLVHVRDKGGVTHQGGELPDAVDDPLRLRLRAQAEDLQSRFGITVEPLVIRGVVDAQLVALASSVAARLLVIAALGERQQRRWLLGSVAERVVQASSIPVLVVRDGACFEAWAHGEHTLRVLVGVELTSTSQRALRWASALRAIGPCDLRVAQIVWPAEEYLRLGLPAPMPLDRLRPDLEQVLQRDLTAWAGELPGPGQTSFLVRPGWGRVDTHLTRLATETQADLLVVGTHQRAGMARLWQGSVSRGVLHAAAMSVVCVPRGEVVGDTWEIPTFQRVLVPTDFSPLANRAIPVAYGLVRDGGMVHLLHVVTRPPATTDPDPQAGLRALIPPAAPGRGIETCLEVVTEKDAAVGIVHAAERLGVDVICMATHGQTGLLQLVLGSQAHAVMQRARQPVLLVPPERGS